VAGELETVAFLFTDIEGSTAMLRAQPDSYGQILSEHGALVRAAISAAGGTERGTEGDSFFCTFPTVGAAVSAAYRAQQALTSHPFPHGGPVWVRMGIHVGAAAHHGRELVGLAIHYAARVAATGHGGQILLSSAAQMMGRNELPAGLWTVDLGRHRLKDFPDVEHLYQLAAEDLRRDFPPPRTEVERSDNLPVALTSFVGREAQLVDVAALVAAHRLVTLFGPGGTGKTRMAIELAGRVGGDLADGVRFVELATAEDEEHLEAAMAVALGVRQGSSGTVAPSADWSPDRSVRQRLVDALRTRQILIVFDNCEHLVTACAALATELLMSCPGVTIVATSQRQLGVRGEVTYRVPPLSVPHESATASEQSESEAVRLFVDRATKRRSDLHIDEAGMRAVASICRKLDGLAHAIELAAARSSVLSPGQILSFLEDQPSFLTGGEAGRHQTLRGALDWSYGLLTAEEQRTLRQLAVFTGDFDLEAARSVVDSDPAHAFAVLDQLSSLADKSLLESETGVAVVRYRLLEGTRQYALEKLAHAREEMDARDRHADHYVALAEAVEPDLRRHGMVQALDRVESELDNLTAAIDHLCIVGTGDRAVRLAGALSHFFVVRGYLSQGRQHLSRSLKASPGADPATLALGAARLASLALFAGDSDDASVLALEALEHAEGHQAIPARISALLTLGLVDANRNRLSDAGQRQRAALLLSQDTGDDWSTAYAENNLGNLELAGGDLRGAADHYEIALTLRRRLGDAWGTTWTLYRLGALATFAGQTDEARKVLAEGCDISTSIRFDQGRVLCLLGLGDAALADGDHVACVDAYEGALAGADDLEDPTVAAIAQGGLVVAAVYANDPAEARRRLADSRLDVPFPFLRAFWLRGAGLLAWAEGDPVRARTLLAEGLSIRAALHDQRRVAEALDDLAAVVVDDDPDRAASLAAAAAAIRDRVGVTLPAGRRAMVEAVHERVRDRPAWAAGSALPIDDAVALALVG